MRRPLDAASTLRVTVDARPLDIPGMRTQGIGRYAHGLLGPLATVAAQRAGQLVLLRAAHNGSSPYDGDPPSGVEVRRLRRPPLPSRLLDWPEQVLLPLDLRRTRAALHHSLSIYRSAVFPGVPAVMSVHDVAPLMWPELYLRTGLGHRMLYRAARRARLLLAPSEAARTDIVDHLGVEPERVAAVPLAADAVFAPTDPRPARERLGLEGPYVLYVGGLGRSDPRKDLEGLVDAFAAWSGPRAETLVLAGAVGDAGSELRARAQGAGARVLLCGFVPDAVLPSLYSGARCFLTAARYEGFGLPALEAVSCGTPVVAFDAGAVPEVAGPGALTVAGGDPAALMRAAGSVCDDEALRERLAGEGRRHAERYSWRRTAELTWDAYERAAGRPAQGGGSRP